MIFKIQLQEELTEIQNVKNELNQKILYENERIKNTMDFGQKMKNEISATNVCLIFFFL